MVCERREASACLIMLSAKQGSHWYHFYNVFGMTRPGIDPTPILTYRTRSGRSTTWAIGGSESSLSAWGKLGFLPTQWAHRDDSDQTGRMRRVIWVFAGRTVFCWFCHEAAHIYVSVYHNAINFNYMWNNSKINNSKCSELSMPPPLVRPAFRDT